MSVPAFPQDNAVVQHYPPATGQSIISGSLVLVNANGQLEVCGTNPTTVAGVALSPITEEFGTIPVALAKPRSTFMMTASSAPAQSNVGKSYGVTMQTGGVWIVDFSKTTNTVVRVESIDTVRSLVEVSVLPSVQQFS